LHILVNHLQNTIIKYLFSKNLLSYEARSGYDPAGQGKIKARSGRSRQDKGTIQPIKAKSEHVQLLSMFEKIYLKAIYLDTNLRRKSFLHFLKDICTYVCTYLSNTIFHVFCCWLFHINFLFYISPKIKIERI